jgi:hypothetical protein
MLFIHSSKKKKKKKNVVTPFLLYRSNSHVNHCIKIMKNTVYQKKNYEIYRVASLIDFIIERCKCRETLKLRLEIL